MLFQQFSWRCSLFRTGRKQNPPFPRFPGTASPAWLTPSLLVSIARLEPKSPNSSSLISVSALALTTIGQSEINHREPRITVHDTVQIFLRGLQQISKLWAKFYGLCGLRMFDS